MLGEVETNGSGCELELRDASRRGALALLYRDNSNIIATAVLFQAMISTLDADLRHHSSLHLVASVALFRVHWSKGGVMYRAGAFKGV